MKRVAFAILLLFAVTVARAQDNQIVFELDDDFKNIDTLPQPAKYVSKHMIGFKYSYEMCTVNSTPNIGQEHIFSPLNFEVTYSYRNPLWDYVNIFGMQMGVKYGKQGYASPYDGWGEINTIVEGQFLAQVHLDAAAFRFLINIGPYYAYRLDTDKQYGFDEYDIRHDYGIFGGVGAGIALGRFEFQVEGGYKYSFCSMYHTYKYSDLYWILAYPQNISVSVGVHYNLW